jgi:hypothetical protein
MRFTIASDFHYNQKKAGGQAKTASRIYRLKTARGCVKESEKYTGVMTHDESGTDI